MDSEIKNSELPDSEQKHAQKHQEIHSQRDRKYSNPNAINSRIFPGEIQLEDQDDVNKEEINKQEWDRKNVDEKNKNSHRYLEDKIQNSHRRRDPDQKSKYIKPLDFE